MLRYLILTAFVLSGSLIGRPVQADTTGPVCREACAPRITQDCGQPGVSGKFRFSKNEVAGQNGQSVGNFSPAQKLLGFSLNLKTDDKSLKIRYKGNVKGIIQSGSDGQYVGAEDAKNRLIGFAVELEGEAAKQFSVEYSAKLAGSAQAAMAKNGAFIGTDKKTGKAIEAISVKLVKK